MKLVRTLPVAWISDTERDLMAAAAAEAELAGTAWTAIQGSRVSAHSHTRASIITESPGSRACSRTPSLRHSDYVNNFWRPDTTSTPPILGHRHLSL